MGPCSNEAKLTALNAIQEQPIPCEEALLAVVKRTLELMLSIPDGQLCS